MRKSFDQQLSIGWLSIEDTEINLRDKSAVNELLAALKAIYANPEYNSKVFQIKKDMGGNF